MSGLATNVGALALRSPILTAAGTSGYGDELAGYGDLSTLGAVVVKSLAAFAWEGNAAPRVASSGTHMLNAVGLAGPGVAAWRAQYLPDLEARGCDVVASIWGRTVEEFAAAAEAMRGANVVALEVNASCPESRESLVDVRALGARDGRDRAGLEGRRRAAVDQTQSQHARPRRDRRRRARRGGRTPWCSSTPCSGSRSISRLDDRRSATAGAA